MCRNSLQKGLLSEVKPSLTHFWEPPSFFFSRQLLVRVVNHTLLLTRSVSRFSTKYINFNEVKLSQSQFWQPPSLSRQLLVRVVNHTLLLIYGVCNDSLQKISIQWGQTLTVALLRTTELFPAVTRAHSESHTTPHTECVTILYKKVSSVKSNLTVAPLRTSEFFLGSYSFA